MPLMRAKLSRPIDWVRASPKLQLWWGVPSLQWSVYLPKVVQGSNGGEPCAAGSDRKVPEYRVHHSLVHMGLHTSRPVRVTMEEGGQV